MSLTVLLACLPPKQAERTARALLARGASVLTADNEKAALNHLEGGTVGAMLVYSPLKLPELRRQALSRGVVILKSGSALDSKQLARLLKPQR